ncbi:MAG: prepilin peptidase [Candidatus Liptonbacteria bacterium]|nr:prepilin peptidase [Candidatus Liptonbacteria bacterium]
MEFILFAFGASVGSFLKVIADRYEEHLFLWDAKIIGGFSVSQSSRSRCPSCGAELRWFELIPIFSFFIQKGRCRRCRRRICLQYPLVEFISGFVFVFVPSQLARFFTLQSSLFVILSALWISVFSILLLISLIDFRLRIIPDEANIMLLVLGIFIIFFQPFNNLQGSFLGHYALLSGLRQNVLLNHLFALFVAGAFFAFLILLTRGRAMGVGDLKLASALGFVFGWPDIILINVLSFVIGSFIGIGAIMLNKKKMKSYIAFGPFLGAASLAVFFFGYQIVDFYLRLFKL